MFPAPCAYFHWVILLLRPLGFADAFLINLDSVHVCICFERVGKSGQCLPLGSINYYWLVRRDRMKQELELLWRIDPVLNNLCNYDMVEILFIFYYLCLCSILKKTTVQRNLLPEEYWHGVLLVQKQKFHQVCMD